MSQRALNLAVRDFIQEVLGLDESGCDVTPGGRPKPTSGQLFVGVHEGGSRGIATESRDDTFTVFVTVSARTPVAPYDEEATAITFSPDDDGLLRVAEKIARHMHTDPDNGLAGTYRVLNLANQYIVSDVPTDATVYGFSVPLRVRNISDAVDRQGAWFNADDAGLVGRSVTITMADAERLQPVIGQF